MSRGKGAVKASDPRELEKVRTNIYDHRQVKYQKLLLTYWHGSFIDILGKPTPKIFAHPTAPIQTRFAKKETSWPKP